MFLGKVQFLFLLFPNYHTLRFLKMKSNPTNKKKLWPNGDFMVVANNLIFFTSDKTKVKPAAAFALNSNEY